jgi:hypothetical protein
MNYLIFTGLSAQKDFDALNARLNEKLGFPCSLGQTHTYATPINHPTTGVMAMPIQDRCLPFLSTGELTALVPLETMVAAGWFKDPTELVATTRVAAMPSVRTSQFAWRNYAAIGGAILAAGATAAAHFLFHLF